MEKEKNNDRNAGRPAKYKEPTRQFGQRVPESKYDFIKEVVNAICEGKNVSINKNIEIRLVDKITPALEKVKSVIEPISECGCKLSGGLLIRGKEKPVCKLTKAQHNF